MNLVARLFLVTLGTSLAGVAAPAARYVEGSVLVTFKPWRDRLAADEVLSRHQLKFSRHFATLSARRLKETGVVTDNSRSTADLIATLQTDPAVETVEPDYIRHVSVVPNDPSFGSLWGLRNTSQSVNGTTGTSGADMSFLPARSLMRPGMPAPVVGVMDTGLDRLHPDLVANVWTNSGESVLFNGVDNDANGKIDDTFGFNFVDNNSDTSDSGYHGTHVAGTIAATGNNGIGVIGANDQAKLMTLKISSDGTNISTSAEIAALQYAVLMKSKGVNLVALNASFGGGGFSTTERSAIVAAGNAGIIFCAAAGNEGANNDTTLTYPASYRLSNMIVVAATDQNDALASFSNYGATSVDLAAPGVNIYSTEPAPAASYSATLQAGATNYAASGLAFSPSGSVTGTLVDCGIGNPGQFPVGVAHNIAFIERGTINFSVKVANAKAAGAKAVVIYNNAVGSMSFTLGGDGGWLPVCSISQANGATIKAALPLTATVTTTRSADYQYLNGTSMATPQVAAAVSLAAMCSPEDTVPQRITRILSTVDFKVSLSGKVITGGRLNLQRMIDSDLNAMPDWWEKLYFNAYTGTAPNGDADADGMTNLNEFMGGTIPTNGQSSFKTLATTRNATNGNVTITWSTVPGKTYQVYYSSTLSGSWSASLPSSLIMAGVGQTSASYTDTTAGPAPKRFYRVQLVPQ